MKKILLILLFLMAALQAQPAEEEVAGGFLALSVAAGADISAGEAQPVVALDFAGASEDYDIRTRIGLLYNAVLVTETFHNRSVGGLYPFSFFAFEVDYTVKRFKTVALQAGYLLAHQGYLYEGFSRPTYQLQLGLRAGVLWFFHRNFMLRGDISLPVGLYRHNLSGSFVARGQVELTWDPLGPIENPNSDSAFYAIGLESEYLSFSAYGRDYEAMRYRPYFRFSLLY